jgi:vacuolar-type H+-ATPase subunit I/STV1
MKTKKSLRNRKEEIKSKLKYNKSIICRRAYRFAQDYSLESKEAMEMAWKEAKEYRKPLIEELETIEDKLENYEMYYKADQSFFGVPSQEAYDSTATVGYMGARCNS